MYIYLTIYNPRDFKYRVRHPLVSTSWRLRECTDFDEWHLKSNLMTWCWNWYDFYVDSPLLSDVAMSWKTVNLAHFAELNIQRYCHFMPFDKKLACLANYQERRSFPWPLVSIYFFFKLHMKILHCCCTLLFLRLDEGSFFRFTYFVTLICKGLTSHAYQMTHILTQTLTSNPYNSQPL